VGEGLLTVLCCGWFPVSGFHYFGILVILWLPPSPDYMTGAAKVSTRKFKKPAMPDVPEESDALLQW
jgi:hypothetical protein